MADKNDTHGLYSELRALYRPRTNAVAPVNTADGGKTCTNLEEIKERWKEHFSNLLNQKGIANNNVFL